MGTAERAMQGRPEYRLFNANTVALATFLCSPLAGAILIATNYWRLGKARKGVLAVIFGLMAAAIPVGIALTWRSPVATAASFALMLLFFFCTWQIAHEVQGEALEEHVARGGLLGTGATAFFVGIATAGGMLGVVWCVAYGVGHRGVVKVGTKDEVVYSGLTTRGTAARLGDALEGAHYLQDRGAMVMVERGFGGTTLSYEVKDGVWNDYGMLAKFEELSREVAPTVGGLPVEVRLLDSEGGEQARSSVGEVVMDGGDGVIYEGEATKEEAEALAEQLREKGVLRGKGSNVVLTRHSGEGTTLAFVMQGEAWNDPKTVNEMETVVREAAPAVGGLPIELHLVDDRLDVKRDELVEQEQGRD